MCVQFMADAGALVGVFSRYTARPAAHFRETLAAARLLALPDEQASEVVRTASACTAAARTATCTAVAGGSAAFAAAAASKPRADPLLTQLGVACLTLPQIMAVVERRA